FLFSTLVFDPSADISITGADIAFVFEGGLLPPPGLLFGDFLGLSDDFIDTFFTLSDGALFSSLFDLDDVFSGDTYRMIYSLPEGGGPPGQVFEPPPPATAPAPGVLFIFFPAVGGILFGRRRR